MIIDIHQIPIPDWSLVCPRCEYPLRGLPSHRCPECGKSLDMNEIVRPWTRLRSPIFTGQEMPIPDFGLNCPVCRGALVGATTHHCPRCRTAIQMEEFRPSGRWFDAETWCGSGLLSAQVETMLATLQIPHIRVQGRGTMDVFLARGSAGGVLYAATEFFFDFLDALRCLRGALRRTTVAAPWDCRSCGEQVPGHFEICWNCESKRTGALQSGPPDETPPRPACSATPVDTPRSAIGKRNQHEDFS